MLDNAAAPHLGQRLLAAGWRQGSLFYSENLSFPFVGVSPPGGSEKATRDAKSWPAGTDFVVVTQDCDIGAPPEIEPFIEVMACKRVADGTPPKLNTAREFLIDRESGLVAITKTRLPVPKEVFLKLTPINWPGNGTEFHLFREWLGRRYTRPAVPDGLVRLLDKPLAERLSWFAKRHPQSWDEFNMVFREVRATVQDQDEPPYEIELVLIAESQGLSEP